MRAAAGAAGARRRTPASRAAGRSGARAGRGAAAPRRRRTRPRRAASRARRVDRGRARARTPRRRRGRPRRPSRARARRPPHAEHLRHPQRPGLGQPAQAGRLRRVLARRASARVFTNAARSSSSSHAVGLVDVAAADPLAAAHRAADALAARAARSVAPQLGEQPAAGGLDLVEHVLEAVRPAVVRVGHVEVGRAGRAGSNSRSSRDLAAPSPSGARRAARAGSRGPSRRSRSKSLEVARRAPAARRPRASCRARAAAAVARASGGSPTCQSPVPALSISISSSSPASRDQRAHHALGGRRAADVAEADEEETMHRGR